ncbi:hypothetical protein [Corynebacterium sp. HMSC073D01]|uniref:hypothetical protein n=1 Tax=Corynebacterium sp. HMSC073D01 TaxID=1739536 RepID=UPI00114CC2DF|nr:hypothetical protein [Corynebacterium sp. HMSC073D01]
MMRSSLCLKVTGKTNTTMYLGRINAFTGCGKHTLVAFPRKKSQNVVSVFRLAGENEKSHVLGHVAEGVKALYY